MPMNLDMNLDAELNQTNSCMLEQHLNEASGSADAEKGGFICGWRLRALPGRLGDADGATISPPKAH
jgi:hypothetical protein